LLADLKSARRADAMRRNAECETAHFRLGDFQRVQNGAGEHCTEYPRRDNEYSRQRRNSADFGSDGHCNRRCRGFRRERRNRLMRGAEERSHGDRGQYRRQRAGDESADQRKRKAAQLRPLTIKRQRKRDRRGAEQEVHELRALEVGGVRSARDFEQRDQQRDRNQHRISQRIEVRLRIQRLGDQVRDQRDGQAEQRTCCEIDPECAELW